MNAIEHKEFLRFRGRQFSPHDLQLIRECVSSGFTRGRTSISREICEQLDWKQPNGWLKDRACRDVLLKLEAAGIITLPPRLGVNNNRVSQVDAIGEFEDYDWETPCTELGGKVSLVFAKGNRPERIWNALVDRFHYLGYAPSVGRSIKYLVVDEGRLLGAVGFASPSWHVASRDVVLSRLDIEQDEIGDRVINNNRFLIRPGVCIKNLASQVLALSVRQATGDWRDYYAVEPWIAETFVDPSRFKGTCYRAANWVKLGSSKGYRKRGASHYNSQVPKDLYIVGLNRHIRRRIGCLVV